MKKLILLCIYLLLVNFSMKTQVDGNFQSSLPINEISELTANDIITIVTYQESNTGAVNFSAIAESNFMINKLQ